MEIHFEIRERQSSPFASCSKSLQMKDGATEVQDGMDFYRSFSLPIYWMKRMLRLKRSRLDPQVCVALSV